MSRNRDRIAPSRSMDPPVAPMHLQAPRRNISRPASTRSVSIKSPMTRLAGGGDSLISVGVARYLVLFCKLRTFQHVHDGELVLPRELRLADAAQVGDGPIRPRRLARDVEPQKSYLSMTEPIGEPPRPRGWAGAMDLRPTGCDCWTRVLPSVRPGGPVPSRRRGAPALACRRWPAHQDLLLHVDDIPWPGAEERNRSPSARTNSRSSAATW